MYLLTLSVRNVISLFILNSDAPQEAQFLPTQTATSHSPLLTHNIAHTISNIPLNAYPQQTLLLILNFTAHV
jgi:hypothetical protein